MYAHIEVLLRSIQQQWVEIFKYATCKTLKFFSLAKSNIKQYSWEEFAALVHNALVFNWVNEKLSLARFEQPLMEVKNLASMFLQCEHMKIVQSILGFQSSLLERDTESYRLLLGYLRAPAREAALFKLMEDLLSGQHCTY